MVAAATDGAHDPWGAFVDRVAAPSGGDGPLAGLRLAVKDNIAVAGLAWTAGLPLFAGRTGVKDASSVAALRGAGAIVVGTAATDSAGFGMMTPGVVNPLAPDRTAGGSSGGCAAAIAGGLADIALGTDTGGSVRVPAACCGLFGLKPTFGSIAVDGVTALSPSFDHVGVLSGRLDHLERAMRVLVPALRVNGNFGRRKIGFVPERLAYAERPTRIAIESVLQRLVAEGWTLSEVELPDALALAEAHGAIVCAEAREIWREHWPRDAARFSDTARRSLAYAQTVGDDEIASARVAVAGFRERIDAAFKDVDFLLGPTIDISPPQTGSRRVELGGAAVPTIFALLAETCPFNVSGHPALAMPLAMQHKGIPVSLQIVGRRGDEAGILALARLLDASGTTTLS